MKIVIYVLCYDEATETVARSVYGSSSWARVYRVDATDPYLENVMYISHLRDLRHEWSDAAYVGTISWKAHDKIRVADLDGLLASPDGTAVLGSSSFDFVSFFHGDPGEFYRQAVRCHPRFMDIWRELARELGLDGTDLARVPPTFGNYWMATPEWMDAYIAFFSRVTTVLDTFPSIQDALWSDSCYRPPDRSDEQIPRLFGRPWMTYHPFVCERLPSAFFSSRGAKMLFAGFKKKDEERSEL